MANGWEKLRQQHRANSLVSEEFPFLKPARPMTPEEREQADREYEAALEKVRKMKEHSDFEFEFSPEEEAKFQEMYAEDTKDRFKVAFQLSDFTECDESPYAPYNKYGFEININHPAIRPFYDEYSHQFVGGSINNHDRWMFEFQVKRELDRLHLSPSDFAPPSRAKKHHKDNPYER